MAPSHKKTVIIALIKSNLLIAITIKDIKFIQYYFKFIDKILNITYN